MEDWEMYSKIQELKKTGLKVAQIARRLDISRNTVYKYINLSPDEFSKTREDALTRMKILDDYKEEISSWLKKYTDMSSSQVLDWLVEKYQGITVSERTVSNFVNQVREEYNIPKTKNPRDYEAVDDPPPGYQCQVDFGTIKLTDASKVSRTLNCITFVLSHSRYKYVEWLDRPFTAADVVNAHEHAFEYYGGYTEEIVYDQDHLIVVSENHGDIIYTREFQIYKDFRNFKTWVCRGADPESKGKVENAVKFVKNNFAKHRTFYSIEEFNEECLKWLERTGNGKEHNTIKKIPAEVFKVEKEYLKPIQKEFLNNLNDESISRTVRKDNTILHGGNRYSVPLGTFNNVTKIVNIMVNDNTLSIMNPADSTVIAIHTLAVGRGNLIKKTHHSRNLENAITPYMEHTIGALGSSEKARQFVEYIHKLKPRYIRDQLQKINEAIQGVGMDVVIDSVITCVAGKMYSAADFKCVVEHLNENKITEQKRSFIENDEINTRYENMTPNFIENLRILSIKPQKRSLDVYGNIAKRRN